MHRWAEHTGEIELEIEAGSAEAVFGEALAALGEWVPVPAEGEPMRREIELAAPDRPALLADWLEELVYLAESSGFAPEAVERFELKDSRLRATVIGRPCPPQTLIKAVTYHRLELAESADGTWSARVVLDV